MAALRNMLEASNEPRIKEQLDFLLIAAEAKLAVIRADIESAFLNQELDGKIRIVPGKSIAWYEEYRANVDEGASAQISGIVDKFFKGSKEDVKAGFSEIVNLSINSLLGSQAAGEFKEKYYFITIEHNALIRVDLGCWRYNFSSDGIMGNAKNAFCFILSKSIIDHKKVSEDALIYFISQQVNDDFSKIEKFIEELKAVWLSLEPQSARGVADRVLPLF